MKKSVFALLMLAILSTPLLVLGIIHIMQVKPEAHQPIVEEAPVDPVVPPTKVPVDPVPSPKSTPPAAPPNKPSKNFMNGYWDGWHGKWLGPIRWTLSDDYRQGHMLGAYDRKNEIDRYPKYDDPHKDSK